MKDLFSWFNITGTHKKVETPVVETPPVVEKIELAPTVVEPPVEEAKDATMGVESKEFESNPTDITKEMLEGWTPDEQEVSDFIDNTPDFEPDLDTKGFLTNKGLTDAHASMIDAALKGGYQPLSFERGGQFGKKKSKAKACGPRIKDKIVHGKRVKIYVRPTKAQVERAKEEGKFGTGEGKKIYSEDRENRCHGKGAKPLPKKEAKARAEKKAAKKKHAKKHEEGGAVEESPAYDVTYYYKDSPEDEESGIIRIGEYKEGVNDEEDDQTFFWVTSMAELKKLKNKKNGEDFVVTSIEGEEKEEKEPKVKKEKKKTGRKLSPALVAIQKKAKELKAAGSTKKWPQIVKEASELLKKEGKI